MKIKNWKKFNETILNQNEFEVEDIPFKMDNNITNIGNMILYKIEKKDFPLVFDLNKNWAICAGKKLFNYFMDDKNVYFITENGLLKYGFSIDEDNDLEFIAKLNNAYIELDDFKYKDIVKAIIDSNKLKNETKI